MCIRTEDESIHSNDSRNERLVWTLQNAILFGISWENTPMLLKDYFKRFFYRSTHYPVETPCLYDFYGTSDVIVIREREKKAPDEAAHNGSTKSKRDEP